MDTTSMRRAKCSVCSEPNTPLFIVDLQMGSTVLACAFIEEVSAHEFNFFVGDHLYCSPSTTLLSFKDHVSKYIRQRYDLDIRVCDVRKAIDASVSFLRQSEANIKRQLGNIADFYEFTEPFLDFDTVEAMESSKDRLVVVFKKASKRPLDLSQTDVHEHMKRSKLTTLPPSEIAKLSVYTHLQLSQGEKLLDDRPSPDIGMPPSPLLYNGFGYFLDYMDGIDDPMVDNIDQLRLRSHVDELAKNMTTYFASDDQRRDSALATLNEKIFSMYNGIQLPSLHASAIDSVRTDGHSHTPSGTCVVFTEFKNEAAGVTTIPNVQVACYFGQWHKHDGGDESRRRLYLGWRIPALGITIVGPAITFYAMTAVDHRVRITSLTPALSFVSSASDGRERASLYRAFTAAILLQVRILRDSQRMIASALPEIPRTARRFPAVCKLSRHDDQESYIAFDIRQTLVERPGRLLYLAAPSGSPEARIVVKFVRQYSTELHDFCVTAGHAPKLLAFERLPGGWYGVAMEYIGGLIPITDAGPSEKRELLKAQIETLVAQFHQEGLVHGDLRDVNILCDCDGDSVVLVDFDWGGKDGEALYPTPNLNPELLGRTSGDLRVRKEDDVRILRNTLAKMS